MNEKFITPTIKLVPNLVLELPNRVTHLAAGSALNFMGREKFAYYVIAVSL